jgi:signal transduction histidine kinase
MLNSLKSKVIFSIILVTLLGVFLSALVVILTVKYQMSWEYGIEKEAAVESLSIALADAMDLENYEQVQRTIESALVYENIASVSVYDTSGNPVAELVEPGETRDNLDISKHTLSINGRTIGSFKTGFSDKYIDNLVEKTVIAMIIVVVGFLLMVGLAFFLFIRHSVLQPIQKFTGAIEEIHTDNLAVKIDISSRDEIGFLAQAFNNMTKNLEKSQTALKQLNDSLEEKVELRTRGERRRTEQLRAINEVGRKISSFLSLNELLPYVVNSLRDTFNYYNVNIFLVNENSGSLELKAGAGGYEEGMPAGLTIDSDKGIIGAVVANSDYVLVPDVSADSRYISSAELPGTRSELAVPIKLGTELMGVLELQSGEIDAFDEIDVFTVQTICDQLAVAIQNTRYYKETRELAVITERNRLAREIHDTLAQGFTGIILQLEAAEQTFNEDKVLSQKHLETARELARESLNEARRSVWALRPQVLENRSFVDALRAETSRFSRETKVNLEISVPAETITISPDTENALLRILQEALNNIRKHAKAENVIVKYLADGSSVVLNISDDGIGFETGEDRKDRFGLISMRERARLLGGSLEIYSETGKGTRLVVRMPVQVKL